MKKRRPKYEILRRTDHRLDMSPAGRNLFVTREKELQQRQAQRIRGWMRLVLVLALIAAGIAAAAVSVIYLAPWFRSEITVTPAVPVSQPEDESSQEIPELPEYDGMGLIVYDESVTLFAVNRNTPAGADFTPELTEVEGVRVDSRMAPALRMLVAAAKEDGLALVFTEGFVSYEEQEKRFEQKTQELVKAKGLSAVMARAEASASVAQPGQSDFQSGLCVRLAGAPATFDKSKTYSWLKANMGKYGFIFRFPQYKEEYTYADYDPTVIRWVGSREAAAMQQRSMCLEEYIDYLASQ